MCRNTYDRESIFDDFYSAQCKWKTHTSTFNLDIKSFDEKIANYLWKHPFKTDKINKKLFSNVDDEVYYFLLDEKKIILRTILCKSKL